MRQSLPGALGLGGALWTGLTAAALMVLPLYVVFAFFFDVAEPVTTIIVAIVVTVLRPRIRFLRADA